MTLAPGTTLGRYQILKPLGSGGMATVYKAYEPSLDRTVALKVIRPGLAEEEGFLGASGARPRPRPTVRRPTREIGDMHAEVHARLRGVTKARRYDVQIRGVPGELRERLHRRAASKGTSMSQYVIQVLKDDLERPTLADWLEEVRRLPPIPGIDAAEIVREVGEARRELEERSSRW